MVRIIGKRKQSEPKKIIEESLHENDISKDDDKRDNTEDSLNSETFESQSADILPPGWSKKVRTRKSGNYMGKPYVHILNDAGRLFRSRKELKSFCDDNLLDIDIEQAFKVDDSQSDDLQTYKPSARGRKSKDSKISMSDDSLDIKRPLDDEHGIESQMEYSETDSENIDEVLMFASDKQDKNDDADLLLSGSPNPENGDIEKTGTSLPLNSDEELEIQYGTVESGTDDDSTLNEPLESIDSEAMSDDIYSDFRIKECYVLLERCETGKEKEQKTVLFNQDVNDRNNSSEQKRSRKVNKMGSAVGPKFGLNDSKEKGIEDSKHIQRRECVENNNKIKHSILNNSITKQTDNPKQARPKIYGRSYIMDKTYFKHYQKHSLSRYNANSSRYEKVYDNLMKEEQEKNNLDSQEDDFYHTSKYISIDLKSCLDMAISIRNKKLRSGILNFLPYA